MEGYPFIKCFFFSRQSSLARLIDANALILHHTRALAIVGALNCKCRQVRNEALLGNRRQLVVGQNEVWFIKEGITDRAI